MPFIGRRFSCGRRAFRRRQIPNGYQHVLRIQWTTDHRRFASASLGDNRSNSSGACYWPVCRIQSCHVTPLIGRWRVKRPGKKQRVQKQLVRSIPDSPKIRVIRIQDDAALAFALRNQRGGPFECRPVRLGRVTGLKRRRTISDDGRKRILRFLQNHFMFYG